MTMKPWRSVFLDWFFLVYDPLMMSVFFRAVSLREKGGFYLPHLIFLAFYLVHSCVPASWLAHGGWAPKSISIAEAAIEWKRLTTRLRIDLLSLVDRLTR